nr:uncharacterized protein LOC123772845 [Procambarus clarkii]
MRELQVMVTVGKASCIHLVVLAGVELNRRRYGASKLLGQASQEARRAVWRGPAWGEVLLSARLIGCTKLSHLDSPVHEVTCARLTDMYEGASVQRHCSYG